MRTMMMALVAAGCRFVENEVDVEGVDPCAEAASMTCPECFDGTPTCRYDGVRVSAGSCGLCQVMGELYQELCDAGETELQGVAECRCASERSCDIEER